MADTMIIKSCTCSHASQDEMYGKGNRAMNPKKDEGQRKEVRCTVCRKVHPRKGD